jgi:hypothetical protein
MTQQPTNPVITRREGCDIDIVNASLLSEEGLQALFMSRFQDKQPFLLTRELTADWPAHNIWSNTTRFVELLGNTPLPLTDIRTIAERGGHAPGQKELPLREIVAGGDGTAASKNAAAFVFSSKDTVGWLRQLRANFTVPNVFRHVFNTPILSIAKLPRDSNQSTSCFDFNGKNTCGVDKKELERGLHFHQHHHNWLTLVQLEV